MHTLIFSFGASCALLGSIACGDDHARLPDVGSPDSPDIAPDIVESADVAHPEIPTLPETDTPDARPANATCRALAPPADRRRAALVPAFTHLSGAGDAFRRLTALVPSGPDTFYASVLGGQVSAFSADPARHEIRTVLDLAARLDLRYFENGLVSIALHPSFAENGYLFAVYIVPAPDQGRILSRIGRFTRAPDGTFDPASERVILDVENASPTHHGNHIAFGTDGLLYFAIGDDKRNFLADPNIAVDAAQDLGDLRGKLLRLDVDVPDTATPAYRVPATNPFVAIAGARPEVFAYGFRNPWRFTIAAPAGGGYGAIYLGDVGHDSREEVDHVVAGGNFGWPVFEGTRCHRESACTDPQYLAPLADYTIGGPKAVVVGAVYTKADVPGLAGRLVFGDYIAGHVWTLDTATGESVQEVEGRFPISSFGVGADGTVYALAFSSGPDAAIYQLAPAPTAPASAFPTRLSETGCVDPTAPHLPAPGVIPFEPAAALWSDGAEKQRFLAVPDDAVIGVGDDGDFDLPDGSVLIKHFAFGGLNHETRLLMRFGGAWRGYSYRWNAAGTDAELLETAVTATLASGQDWTYPSRSQCATCHTEAAGYTLGLEVAQLDRPIGPAPDGPNQLAWLAAHGYLAAADADLPALRARATPLADPHGAAPVADRARAYLHVNCSGCHRPGGARPRGDRLARGDAVCRDRLVRRGAADGADMGSR